MAHVPVREDLPGIRGLMAFRPETGSVLSELAEVLLRGPSSLTRGERELIAAVVSTRNDCTFCYRSHAAFAAAQIDGGTDIVEAVRRDPASAPISMKLRRLIAIAERVQEGGKKVDDEVVSAARTAGATDVEIHDTVLIAAAFCMFNRYVDGLAATTPNDPHAYESMAKIIVRDGYVRPL
jgi:uncharacterized peroxidase-related enzyme